MTDQGTSWTVCQIGARENYAVARALHAREALAGLVTDAWVRAHSPLGRISSRLGERRHEELQSAPVWAPTGRAIMRQGLDRAIGRSGWRQMMARNAWFQHLAARRIAASKEAEGTVFAYSYAAAGILAAARARGWKTVLGQIDPGPVEARMVSELYRAAGQAAVHEPIPEAYWDNWRRETELADAIVVNSDWSRRALVSEGVPDEKITIIPLAFEASRFPVPWERPISRFTPERPLRLLYLGQVSLRKGADILLEAIRQEPDLKVHLDIVGALQMTLPDWIRNDPRISFHGSVPRSAVDRFYAQADVFVFPTRSDGFGLTQLEALSTGVPVIATERCGEAVAQDVNGLILPDLQPSTLAQVLRDLVAAPERVARWRRAARLDERFSLDALGRRLSELGKRLQEERSR